MICGSGTNNLTGSAGLLLASLLALSGCGNRTGSTGQPEVKAPKVIVKAEPIRESLPVTTIDPVGEADIVAESADVLPIGSQTPDVVVDSGGISSSVEPGVLPDFAGIYTEVSPAVVKITTYGRVAPGPELGKIAMGTGFFYGAEGEVLTNAHVVKAGRRFEIETTDGRVSEARLVGQDPLTDLALLHVEMENPPRPLPGAPVASLRPGMWVLAIGNPLGLEFSASKGIVSALNRNDVLWDGVGYWDFIQTDAAINEGNSGGPLVDVRGRVVGICSAIEKGAHKIGFAIPVETAIIVSKHLKKYGKLMRAWMGIKILEVDGDVQVVGVYPDSPAIEAGFLPDDIILELDGEPARDVQQVRWRIAIHELDIPALFKVERDGMEIMLEVHLGKVEDLLRPAAR